VKTAKFTKHAFEPEISMPQSWGNRDDRAQDGMRMSTIKQKREQTKREKELDKAKAFKLKMRSRLRSFKRLVERYNDILSKQDLDKVYDELYSLEKSVSRLDVYASLHDCVVRSANRLNKFGFTEGAEFLHKCAEEPQQTTDVVESLPPGSPTEPDLPQQSAPMISVQTIISRLEGTSKALKSRDMIRELASIDILLNEMGMASYFPELSFAQSKLIEAFGYASNKVEDIVAKLRGTGTSKPKATDVPQNAPTLPDIKEPVIPPPAPDVQPQPKPIDTDEILNKPVTKVKKQLPPTR